MLERVRGTAEVPVLTSFNSLRSECCAAITHLQISSFLTPPPFLERVKLRGSECVPCFTPEKYDVA